MSCEQEEGNKGKVVLVQFKKAYGRLEVFHLFVTSAIDKGEWSGQLYVQTSVPKRQFPKPTEYELRRSIEVVWRLGKMISCSSWESNKDSSVDRPIAYYAIPNSFKILALSGS